MPWNPYTMEFEAFDYLSELFPRDPDEAEREETGTLGALKSGAKRVGRKLMQPLRDMGDQVAGVATAAATNLNDAALLGHAKKGLGALDAAILDEEKPAVTATPDPTGTFASVKPKPRVVSSPLAAGDPRRVVKVTEGQSKKDAETERRRLEREGNPYGGDSTLGGFIKSKDGSVARIDQSGKMTDTDAEGKERELKPFGVFPDADSLLSDPAEKAAYTKAMEGYRQQGLAASLKAQQARAALNTFRSKADVSLQNRAKLVEQIKELEWAHKGAGIRYSYTGMDSRTRRFEQEKRRQKIEEAEADLMEGDSHLSELASARDNASQEYHFLSGIAEQTDRRAPALALADVELSRTRQTEGAKKAAAEKRQADALKGIYDRSSSEVADKEKKVLADWKQRQEEGFMDKKTWLNLSEANAKAPNGAYEEARTAADAMTYEQFEAQHALGGDLSKRRSMRDQISVKLDTFEARQAGVEMATPEQDKASSLSKLKGMNAGQVLNLLQEAYRKKYGKLPDDETIQAVLRPKAHALAAQAAGM